MRAWLLSLFLGFSMSILVHAAPGFVGPVDDDGLPIGTVGNDDESNNLTARVNPKWKSYYPLPMIQAKGKTIIPSPQELLQIIKPEVSSGTCLFYTGLGDGRAAQKKIKNWYKCNIQATIETEDGEELPPEDPITETSPRPPIIAGQAGDINELVVYQALMKSVDYCNVDQLHDAGGAISASRLRGRLLLSSRRHGLHWRRVLVRAGHCRSFPPHNGLGLDAV